MPTGRPWERYGAAPPPATAGPWTKYQAAPAAPEQPGMLERAGDAVSWIGDKSMGLLDWQIRRGGRAVMDLPQQAMDTAKHLAGTTATHYRTLAHGVGLPVDPPTPEASQQYRSDVIDAGATLLGGAVGRFIGKGATEIAKRAGRGWQTRAGADRLLAREAQHVVPPGGAPTTTALDELTTPAITAGGTAAVVDVLDPTPWEFTDAPVAGGAGVAAGAIAMREGATNLLIQNPRWRNLVMRGTPAAPLTTAIGATIGYLLSRGIQLGAEEIDNVIRFVTEGEPEAEPEDEQSAIARRLMEP